MSEIAQLRSIERPILRNTGRGKTAVWLLLLVALALPARALDLYRTNAAGTWTDSKWVDTNKTVYSEPTLFDNAIIGCTGSPGVLSASVTVTVGIASASNVYLGYYTGAAASAPAGSLRLFDNTALVISNRLVLGSGSSYQKGIGSLLMGTNTSLSLGVLEINEASSFTFRGGTLSLTGDVFLADDYIRGSSLGSILTQDGGTQSVPGNIWMGNASGGINECNSYLRLTNGAVLNVAKLLLVGASARGQGLLSLSSNSLLTVNNIQFSKPTTAGHTIAGDTLVVSNRLQVGDWSAGHVTLNQNGGTLTAGWLDLGEGILAGDSGTLRMTNNATLQLIRRPTGSTTNCLGGVTGDKFTRGFWYLGDANSPGTVTLTGAGSGKHDLSLRPANLLTNMGGVVGWGSVGMDGKLTMNGFVIADGYGQDRDLTLTNFSLVTSSIENTTTNIAWSTNGWYARNGGRLLLPAQTISSGNSTVNWGEAAADTNIDLVNSCRMVFTGVAGGPLAVSLLATNRTDALVTAGTVIGEWAFDTAPGFSFGAGTATVAFRYDSELAGQKGLTEATLRLWQRRGSKWQDVTGAVNTSTNNKQIVSVPLSSFSLFAVGPDIPKTSWTGALLLVK